MPEPETVYDFGPSHRPPPCRSIVILMIIEINRQDLAITMGGNKEKCNIKCFSIIYLGKLDIT